MLRALCRDRGLEQAGGENLDALSSETRVEVLAKEIETKLSLAKARS